MRVIVCGGRKFVDADMVELTLDHLGVTELAEGGAEGADALAKKWAHLRGIPVATYRARWALEKKAAGPLRNQRMLDGFKPDAVIAFPGGRGTADMVARARKANVKVIEVDP